MTVRAIRDVVVWTIPKAQLLGLFGQKHTTFKERRRVLMRNSLFRDLREEQIEALSRMVTEKSVSGGQTVYRAGDSADNIYFVVKGSVKLCLGTNKTMSSEEGSSKGGTASKSSLFEVDRVFENSSFGEVETVLGFSGYGSTVIALSPSDGGTQSRTILLVLAKDLCPSVCRAVAPKIARRLVFDVIRSVPSFSNLGNASIFELVKSLRCSNVMKGTCLIRQNSNMRRFVIVLGGIVTQTEKDGKKSVNLMRGSSFGSTSTTLTLSQFQYTATTNVRTVACHLLSV